VRRWRGWIALVVCVAAAAGVAHLHGYERGLGHEDWRYRPALIGAYSRDVAFHAGPCVLAGIAAVLAAWRRTWTWLAPAAAVAVAVVSAAATYFNIRQYIVTPPGQFMPTTVWDGVALLAWVAVAVFLVLAAVAPRASDDRLVGVEPPAAPPPATE
jgi:hypothetical protein